MTLDKFLNLIEVRAECTTKSVFGNTGIFYRGAMFAQADASRLFLRGCPLLDEQLRDLGCPVYIQTKKRSSSEMNYFDVSRLVDKEDYRIREFVTCSYQAAYQDQLVKKTKLMSRLRDLPNMNHTLERMLKHCNIMNVEQFKRLGAAFAVVQIRRKYGKSKDLSLLWKFHGAINSVHWELIPEDEKQWLIDEYNKIEWDQSSL